MKFLLSEQEMADHKNEVSKLKNRVQELVGQLAEVKGVQGCPAIGSAKNLNTLAVVVHWTTNVILEVNPLTYQNDE